MVKNILITGGAGYIGSHTTEILIKNRDKLIESESFILTLQKDKTFNTELKKRINVKKILKIEEIINKPYSKVTIELKDNFRVEEVKEILSKSGDTQINLIINFENKKANYSLKNNRKFDLNNFKALKDKEYVAKITV